MRAKNLIGVNNRGLRFGYAFASSPVIEQKNEYICMKIKDISYTLFGILSKSLMTVIRDFIPIDGFGIMLSSVEVKGEIISDGIRINSVVKSIGKTGVEMEALTAVSVALLTVYDMCKAVDKNMILEDIRLTGKSKASL